MNQTTIQRVVTCSGIGLHSGNKVYLALRPASANTGIIFDIHTPDGIRRVSPAPKAVATTVLATTLGSDVYKRQAYCAKREPIPPAGGRTETLCSSYLLEPCTIASEEGNAFLWNKKERGRGCRAIFVRSETRCV